MKNNITFMTTECSNSALKLYGLLTVYSRLDILRESIGVILGTPCSNI